MIIVCLCCHHDKRSYKVVKLKTHEEVCVESINFEDCIQEAVKVEVVTAILLT